MLFASKFMNCSLWIICLGLVVPTLSGQESRREFFGKLRTINADMTMDQVESILGKPDDIWTRDDKIIHDPHVEVVWAYGSNAHLQLPTLGRVGFDHTGTVYQIIGRKGRLIAADVIEEDRLNELLQLLASGPRIQGLTFDPYELISLANAFQPLGQEKAFAVFREFERVTERDTRGEEVIRLLLLCLHKVPKYPGYLPRPGLGLPLPVAPDDIRSYPRFPLHFVNGIPFLLVQGYHPFGERPSATVHMKEYQDKIAWVDAPLYVSKKPAIELSNSLREFRQSPSWRFHTTWAWSALTIGESGIMGMLESQLRRFVETRDENVNRKK